MDSNYEIQKQTILQSVILSLQKVKGPDKQGWYTAFCIFHPDKHRPNLRFRETGFTCLACGEKGNLKKLAVKLGIDIYTNPNNKPQITHTYDYSDEKGNLLFQVVRYFPKAFKQRRLDGKGGWIWNLEGVQRVLYRLPELLTSQSESYVFITEGEKDVEAIRSLGLVATCNPGGAGKFTEDMKGPLQGKYVIVIADKDEPGRRHAAQVKTLLEGITASVKVIELPGEGVKDAADWVAVGGSREKLLELVKPAELPEIKKGSDILDNIVSFLRRFVVITTVQAYAIALWVIHCYNFQDAEATPYLYVHSTEKRSGKTRLLEVLELLVPRPWLTGHVTAAALTRKIDAESPTLLLDESDTAFKGDKEYAETLRGILNSGYRRGGKCTVCVGQGTKISYKDFSTFCPKAIAGIGKLPGTVVDRSIPILLHRRIQGENVERFRRRHVENEAKQIYDDIVNWLKGSQIAITVENIPDQIDDRAADCWEPLLAIADAAAGIWPEEARKAAIALMNGESRNDDSLGIQLLSDIQKVFDYVSEIPSSELVEKLNELDESPWGDLKGKPLTQRSLAALLKPYEIKPTTIRVGDTTPRGYKKEHFQDSWQRYLPQSENRSATSKTPGSDQTQNDMPNHPQQTIEKPPDVADSIHAQSSLNVLDVADEKAEIRDQAQQIKVEDTENKKWSIVI